MTEPLSQTARKTLKAEQFWVIIVIVQLFLLVSGEMVYSIDRWMTITYIVLPISAATALVLFGGMSREELFGRPRRDFITRFLKLSDRTIFVQLLYCLVAFLATWAVLLALTMSGNLATQTTMEPAVLSVFLGQLLLVAPSETLTFQVLIPRWLDAKFLAGKAKQRLFLRYAVSQGLFAVFHFAAYGQVWTALVGPLVSGCVFLALTENYGASTAIGCHLAWNLSILGIITGGIIHV